MIGIWQSYSDAYLYVAGVAMLATFGIPLLVVPLRWARASAGKYRNLRTWLYFWDVLLAYLSLLCLHFSN
jgi:hypothetical protein